MSFTAFEIDQYTYSVDTDTHLRVCLEQLWNGCNRNLLRDTDLFINQGCYHAYIDRSQIFNQGSSDLSERAAFASPLAVPGGLGARCYWVMMLPVRILFTLTVPNCQRLGCWQTLFPLTFLMSVLWIAGLSYIMVWMVTIAGILWSGFVYNINMYCIW